MKSWGRTKKKIYILDFKNDDEIAWYTMETQFVLLVTDKF